MYNRFLKRMIDLIIAIIAFPFWAVLAGVVAVAIKADDHGPVFYKAKRIGQKCKLLEMYKFRSMKVDAPSILNEDGSTYNSVNDSRVTRIGKILRETSIDETAQIINVIKGDMSLIGPRASEWTALESYKPDELDKMKVKPGISGYTQAYFRNNLSVREKRLKDAWYANNVSFLLDVKIFFKTIQTVLTKEGLYTNDVAYKMKKEKEHINVK